jgi:hypothetical protein
VSESECGGLPLTGAQVREFEEALRALSGDQAWKKHKVTVLPPQRDLDSAAARFAREHGSFSLHFDATQNYVAPDDCPWTLLLDSSEDGWGGFTAMEALEFAESSLGQETDAQPPFGSLAPILPVPMDGPGDPRPEPRKPQYPLGGVLPGKEDTGP